MPRKSAEDKALARQRASMPRPKPPADMPHAAKQVWADIVNCRPADFFSPGNLQLLAKYCRVSVLADQALADVETAPDDIETVKRYKLLNDMAIALASKLRRTIQSVLRGDTSKARETLPDAGPDRSLLGGNVVSLSK